jgi:hypothetical protein
MPSAFEKYAKVNVPRFTSYPTAPHFSARFPAGHYREWARPARSARADLALSARAVLQTAVLILRLQHEAGGAVFAGRHLCKQE